MKLIFVLVLALVVPPGCITVPDSEQTSFSGDDLTRTTRRVARGKNVSVKYAIPRDGEASGNPKLQNLLDQGIVPICVEITNESSEILAADAATLTVKDHGGALHPIGVKNLPTRFESFNGEALTANFLNVVIVVVATVGIIYVLADGCNGCANDVIQLGFRGDDDSEAREQRDDRIFNSLTKMTYVTYEDPYEPQAVLGPGETLKGMMFFRAPGRDPHWQSLRLKVESPRR
jgi:hypothetical protein